MVSTIAETLNMNRERERLIFRRSESLGQNGTEMSKQQAEMRLPRTSIKIVERIEQRNSEAAPSPHTGKSRSPRLKTFQMPVSKMRNISDLHFLF
jgi:hypothetical protein